MLSEFQFSVISPANSTYFRQVTDFLSKNDLSIDSDVEYLVIGWAGETLVACGGLAGRVLKSIAIDPAYRGSGLSLKLVTELLHVAYEKGQTELFLFTKPDNESLFSGAGFYTIAKADCAVLMENHPNRLVRYCKTLQKSFHPGKKIGGIVMNANPFTLGHHYLIEQAAKQCDWLHLFIVKEDASEFRYQDRFALVSAGTHDIANLTVHPGSDYLISRATFPSYFIKDSGVIDRCHTEIDLQIFRRFLAPALGINYRFVGTEPLDRVTNDYNKQMKTWLEAPDGEFPAVNVVEMPRLMLNDEVISASKVRKKLHENDIADLDKWVPPTTLAFLLSQQKQNS